MCGIVGIFAYRDSSTPVDIDELRRSRDHMQTRGPDGHGEWLAPDRRIGLAHRRLAIIDLTERATQPMQTSDGRLHVTFNGEIYNHRALRSELEHKGYVFRTTSDTEVLLHLYRDRGVDMLRALRGMYAFGLWDAEARSLLLARDPYGIKPLYYANHAGTLRFASQVKALLAGERLPRGRDTAGHVGFHLWGYVPEPFTTYASIAALPAGCHLIATESGVGQPQHHFSLARTWAEACEPDAAAPRTGNERRARVRTAVRESVAAHLIADVPVSTFLSAGVDSGALAGVMSEAMGRSQTHAITLAFSEFSGQAHDEAPPAAQIAERYGLIHHVRRVDEQEFHDDLPAVLAAMDQPTIDGLNTWFVSKATAELGLKVAVSGLGGDELFGGYPSFRQVPRLARAAAWPARVPYLGRGVRSALPTRMLQALGMHPKLAGAIEYGSSLAGAYWLTRGLFMPWELPALMPEDLVYDGLAKLVPELRLESLLVPKPADPWAQVAVLEAAAYMRNQLLRDTDWASMAHSLEVRVPLVDHVLLQQVAPSLIRAPLGAGKRWLGASPTRALPSAITRRAKTGFTTPIAQWLRRSQLLEGWREQPSLNDPTCPWARRYAYCIAQLVGS
ncbi:MAG: asparagine synthase (glutamine-hydrolyzing) [Polyangiales bacterium]